jgi:intracellular multiplication protein IcmE
MIHIDDKNDEFDDFEDADFENDDYDDMDDNAFDDFDETQQGSLKDIWQNNPLVKLAVIGVGLLVVITAIFLFSGDSEKPESKVGGASGIKELPSTAELTPDMIDRIDETNEFGERVAEATMGSFVPVSTETFKKPEDWEKEKEEMAIKDPLSQWREKDRQKKEEIELPPEPEKAPEPVAVPAPQPQLPPAAPNQQMAQALGNGLAAQMRQILQGQSIGSIRNMSVTERAYIQNQLAQQQQAQQAAASGDNSAAIPVPAEIFVPAGEVYYAQTLTEANTDAPGPVLAQILQGPLKGSRLIGAFSENEEYLTIDFNKVVYKERTISIDAIALDEDTTLTGVVTDIDHRYFKRVILPAAAAFVEGFGSAVAETGSTSVAVTGETVTTSEEDLNTREELMKGVEESTSIISEFLQEEADRTEVMIKVAAGTPIGVLFLKEITQAEADGFTPTVQQQTQPQTQGQTQ